MADLHGVSIDYIEARCLQIQRCLQAVTILPRPASTSNFVRCARAVQLLQRTQPSMLEQWTPVYIEGDGNCMFRAISQAVFGTQDVYMQLRLLACLEVGTHRALYDTSNPACHELLKRDILLPPAFPDLWLELTSLGQACTYVALLALSAVLSCRVSSFFPPMQSAFVSPLTLEITGRAVSANCPSVAVMWSTLAAVPDRGPVDINHIVTLQRHVNSAVQPTLLPTQTTASSDLVHVPATINSYGITMCLSGINTVA